MTAAGPDTLIHTFTSQVSVYDRGKYLTCSLKKNCTLLQLWFTKPRIQLIHNKVANYVDDVCTCSHQQPHVNNLLEDNVINNSGYHGSAFSNLMGLFYFVFFGFLFIFYHLKKIILVFIIFSVGFSLLNFLLHGGRVSGKIQENQ